MSSPPPSLPTELAFLSLFPPSDSDDGSENEFESEAPKKLSSREERIQRAIEEGKKAYGWDQAETRFGVRSVLSTRMMVQEGGGEGMAYKASRRTDRPLPGRRVRTAVVCG